MNQFSLTIRKIFILCVVGFSLTASNVLTGCKPTAKSESTSSLQNGKLIKAEKIGEFDTTKLNRILQEELEQFLTGAPMAFSEFKGKYEQPVYSVTLYKITYQSNIPEKNNEPSQLTGLVAIPSTFAEGTPMVSYQHGTVFAKNEVPSNIEESIETKLMIAQFGGQGYIVIAADYDGVGQSKNPNTYFSRRSNEQACLDMFSAAQEFLEQEKIKAGHFFTMGWSQGAYNTLIFLRRLEQAKISVTATATAATPADLNYFISHGILNPRPEDAVWIPGAFSMLLQSYENYQGLNSITSHAIRPEYLQAAKDFYSFKITFPEFFQKTTPKVVDFLNPEFIEEMRDGSSPLVKALNEAEGYRWRSKTPLRSYYGEKDEAVPVELAKLAVEYQKAMGKKNGELILAGANADHRCTYAMALYDVKPWFDSFLKK
jgi:pimeloyl-ACP methyl ester carboxylesterase